METRVTTNVPPNQIQDIISQIRNRENLISQKISEIEILQRNFASLLIFVFFIIFLLFILNIYFFLRWKKNLSFSETSKKKEETKKEKQKNKTVEKKSALFQIPCKIKNCPFFRENKPCLLFEFGEKLSNFLENIFQNRKNDFLTSKILEISKSFFQNCYFGESVEEKKFENLKRNLKKIRYFLNKIKKEKGVPTEIKNEAEVIWNLDHKLSQKISKFLKIH